MKFKKSAKNHKYYRQTKRVRQETIIKREKEAKTKLTKITSSHDESNFVDESM